ncbi:hypothetical protein [Motilibacter deserti]|uniref:Uncharacterized protein n=1 Tax=Motilibacter deserti TaxID=2714956 RepID=A0ABX0GY43_9ACTN|nr:hypothetical protein [Motilibacter deserti]NHC15911.1 hypothetical protein [Motilibacter deserti]
MSFTDHDVAEALRAELARRAEPVVPSRYDFAGRAIGAGRLKRRVRRRAVSALAAVVLVGGPGTAAVVASRDEADVRPEPVPTSGPQTPSPTPTPTPAPSSTVAATRLAAADLQQGAAPTVPYIIGNVLHDGHVSVELALPGPPVSVARLGSDWIVGTLVESSDGDLNPGAAVGVKADGSSWPFSDTNARGVVAAPNGERAVWADGPRDGSTTTLHAVLDGGVPTMQSEVAGAWTPVGFIDDARVLLRLTQGAEAAGTVTGVPDVSVWDTRTGESTPLPAGLRGRAAGAGLLSVLTEEETPEFTPCAAVVEFSTSQMLWRSCEWIVQEFSPDGRTALAESTLTDGVGPSQYALVDARTGSVLVRWDGNFRDGAFEDDGMLVFPAAAARDRPNSFAVVRCDSAGGCVRATELQTVDATFRDDWNAVVGR